MKVVRSAALSSVPRLRDDDGHAIPYWELDRDARREADPHVMCEEGYLAWDINHARRMLSVPFECIPECTDLIPDPVPADIHHEDQLDYYSDRIATLLAAAMIGGFDPVMVAERSLRRHRSALEENHDMAERRVREMNEAE